MSAHVQIGYNDGKWSCKVNGQEMGGFVTLGGLHVSLPGGAEVPHVSLTLIPDVLDLDLPDAVLDALRAEPYVGGGEQS